MRLGEDARDHETAGESRQTTEIVGQRHQGRGRGCSRSRGRTCRRGRRARSSRPSRARPHRCARRSRPSPRRRLRRRRPQRPRVHRVSRRRSTAPHCRTRRRARGHRTGPDATRHRPTAASSGDRPARTTLPARSRRRYDRARRTRAMPASGSTRRSPRPVRRGRARQSRAHRPPRRIAASTGQESGRLETETWRHRRRAPSAARPRSAWQSPRRPVPRRATADRPPRRRRHRGPTAPSSASVDSPQLAPEQIGPGDVGLHPLGDELGPGAPLLDHGR